MYALLYKDASSQCTTLDHAKNLLTARMEALKDAINPHVVVSFLGQHQAQAENDPASLLKQDILGQGNTSAPTGQEDLDEVLSAIEQYLITETCYAFDGESISITMTRTWKEDTPSATNKYLFGGLCLVSLLLLSAALLATQYSAITPITLAVISVITGLAVLLTASVCLFKHYNDPGNLFQRNFQKLQSYRKEIEDLPNVIYQTTDSAQPKATAHEISQKIICTFNKNGWHHTMQHAFAQPKMLESPASGLNPVSSPALQDKGTSREKPPQQGSKGAAPTASSESKP